MTQIHRAPNPLKSVDETALEDLFRSMLRRFQLDHNSPHLRDTPRRVIQMYKEFFYEEPWNFTTFPVEGESPTGIVLVRDIPFRSLCAHHWLPFVGVGHIAYIPNKEIVGLSKLARALRSFSLGPNVQEDIGRNVASFLEEKLQPIGVGVILEAEHTCMTIRGVQAHGTVTVTSDLRGCFFDEDSARAELFALIRS